MDPTKRYWVKTSDLKMRVCEIVCGLYDGQLMVKDIETGVYIITVPQEMTPAD